MGSGECGVGWSGPTACGGLWGVLRRLPACDGSSLTGFNRSGRFFGGATRSGFEDSFEKDLFQSQWAILWGRYLPYAGLSLVCVLFQSQWEGWT